MNYIAMLSKICLSLLSMNQPCNITSNSKIFVIMEIDIDGREPLCLQSKMLFSYQLDIRQIVLNGIRKTTVNILRILKYKFIINRYFTCTQ